MKSIFHFDSPVMRFLGKIADLMILNILYLISCIPLVTIGAANAALYDVCARLSRDDALIWRHYWKAFRSNFKKATAIWLILAAVAAILYGCGIYYWSYDMPGEDISVVMLAVAAGIWLLTYSWVFPLQARFENTIKRTLLNGLLCSFSYFPRTILMAIANAIPLAVFLFLPGYFLNYLFVFLVFWFSCSAYLLTLLLKKTMAQLEDLAQD